MRRRKRRNPRALPWERLPATPPREAGFSDALNWWIRGDGVAFDCEGDPHQFIAAVLLDWEDPQKAFAHLLTTGAVRVYASGDGEWGITFFGYPTYDQMLTLREMRRALRGVAELFEWERVDDRARAVEAGHDFRSLEALFRGK